MNNKKYLGVKDAARFLDVNPETLRRWDREFKFHPSIKTSTGERIYDLEHLEIKKKEREASLKKANK